MYKYSTHHHASGTPFGYVNGVMLEKFLETAEAWRQMLNDTYQLQKTGW